MSSVASETGLEPAVGAHADVESATETYAVDGVVPRFVATPRSVGDLAPVLAIANERNAAVIPWGGERHISLGNIPSRYDIALRTTALDRVIEYEPADMTITVEAGLAIGKLQSLLAQHGQFLPIDARDDATVGGVLAANVSGPSRHAYGLPRDWLIGCRVAHVDGSISKGGGRVVKNVAGYDMPKLYVGSLGTLGVIVEATFKLAPLLVVQETLIAHCASIDAAAGLIFAADERSLALRSVALRPAAGESGTIAAFWLAGSNAAVERTRREVRELCPDARRLEGDASAEFWSVPSPEDSAVELKTSLTPSAVLEYLHAIDGAKSVAYPTTGLALSTLASADTDALVLAIEEARRVAERLGGSLVVTSAPVEVKQRIDVWGPSTGSGQAAGSALPLMRRLKEQFDPRGTLNPGRFVGGI